MPFMNRFIRNYQTEFRLIIVLVLMILFLSFSTDTFFTLNNFTNLIAKQLKNKIDISNDNLFKHFEKLWLKMI